MAIVWNSPPKDVTPGTVDSWVDVDDSTVPDAAEGVILRFHIDDTVDRRWAARNNGSGDDRRNYSNENSYTCIAVGVDGSGIFEVWVDHANVKVHLVGHFDGNDETFFTNAVDKQTTTTGSWVDVDISGDTGADTAIGGSFEFTSGNANDSYYLRKNGSTDNRVGSSERVRRTTGIIVGVDGSEICEQYIDATANDLWLNGYITGAATFNTNAPENSIETVDQWLDLSAMPSGAVGGIFEVDGVDAKKYGFRKNGDTENRIGELLVEKAFHVVELDGSRLGEGYVEDSSINFWELGYFEAGTTAHSGVVASDGVATVTVVGINAATGIVSVAGVGATTIVGALGAVGVLSPAGVATVTPSGTLAARGVLSSAGVAAVTVVGLRSVRGIVAPSGVATTSPGGILDAIGQLTSDGVAAVSPVGTIVYLGQCVSAGAGTVAVVGGLALEGSCAVSGIAAVSIVGTLTEAPAAPTVTTEIVRRLRHTRPQPRL